MIDPRGLSFTRWAATVTEEYADYGLPILMEEAAWVEWALQVVSTPSLLDEEALPNPRLYETAEEWARDLYAVVEG